MSANHSGVSTSDPSALHRMLQFTVAQNVFQAHQSASIQSLQAWYCRRALHSETFFSLSRFSRRLSFLWVCGTFLCEDWVVDLARLVLPPDDAFIFGIWICIFLLSCTCLYPSTNCYSFSANQARVSFAVRRVRAVTFPFYLDQHCNKVQFFLYASGWRVLYKPEKVRWFGWSFHPSVFSAFEVRGFFLFPSPEHGQQCCTPSLNCSAFLTAIWQNLPNIP